MRLWHEDLLTKLPRPQLLGQHRECCALRGGGWKRPHATVNYIFSYSPYKLYQYHVLVMDEMKRRGYQPDEKWYDAYYRGKTLPPYTEIEKVEFESPLYLEHDDDYLNDCLANLEDKGIIIK